MRGFLVGRFFLLPMRSLQRQWRLWTVLEFDEHCPAPMNAHSKVPISATAVPDFSVCSSNVRHARASKGPVHLEIGWVGKRNPARIIWIKYLKSLAVIQPFIRGPTYNKLQETNSHALHRIRKIPLQDRVSQMLFVGAPRIGKLRGTK
jgi:hypothetical protein